MTRLFLHFGTLLAMVSWGFASADKSANQYNVVLQDSLASAMMLGLANQDTAFIFDKVENNPQKTASGKPTWASIVNLNDFSVRGLDATTNPFCAAGATLGNGSYIVVGGNSAISYGGQNVKDASGQNNLAGPAAPYNDMDGRRVVRIMEPQEDSSKLQWDDEYNSPNQMDSARWYPAIEGLADGSVVIIGGATNGGFINRNYPNVDPVYSTDGKNPPTPGQWDQGGSNPSYEFWPPAGKPKPAISQFMVKTSGLNMYAHTYLMPSGKIFMQANYSTTLWDWQKDKYYDLDDMPDKVIRVYPASGATAMKPLTPANQYTPSILFCGGFNNMSDSEWGDYTAPRINVYERAGSTDCSSITPEKPDGTMIKNAKYVREDKLPEPRSMGQFIHLPTGEMVIVNGASRGLAGYGNTTWNTVKAKDGSTVYLEGMSQMPTYRPVIYNPDKPLGQRLRYSDLGSSSIARLYHSSALLIPDGSVLVAGSNPHMDVSILPTMDQLDTQYESFNTTYAVEQWYPDYYFKTRPVPDQMPDTISYGGSSFNVTIGAKYMNPNNNANDMANKTKFMVIRPGFSTHAINFGQRSLQLENSFDVHDDGSVTFIVNPMPTNINIFVPGPALLFATVNGVPSHGKFVQLGGKDMGPVPFALTAQSSPAPLPSPKTNSKFTNKATSENPDGSVNDGLSGGAIAGIVVGVIVGLLLLAAILFFVLRRSRQKRFLANYASVGRPSAPRSSGGTGYAPSLAGMSTPGTTGAPAPYMRSFNDPYDSSHLPMMQGNDSAISLSNLSGHYAKGHPTGPSAAMMPPSSTDLFAQPMPTPSPDQAPAGYTYEAAPPRNQAPAGYTYEMAPPTSGSTYSNPFFAPSSQQLAHVSSPSSGQTVGYERGPVLMPEGQTEHWNDVPAQPHHRMSGPRQMPTSNLQQHLRAANQR
ncbi:(methyl)glyoxal oxidase [Malassezia pachydermatis]|uniref:Copper radical oxidase n=1 Tax=Malassezia pachydermatis TaxID=77020 RepID=A0A0M8MXZ3_9BASI|nr:hypothetical protein Malapachy_3273 [Malassezia pachydermatis]KOS16010.1 hypothetical protein Malapachy_3273 [Malassezia pachydermatis]